MMVFDNDYLFPCLQLVEGQRAYFNSGKTRDLSWRREQLTALIRLVDEGKEELCQALQKDLHKVSCAIGSYNV